MSRGRVINRGCRVRVQTSGNVREGEDADRIGLGGATREERSAMVKIGYTMMTEQAGPRELVDHVVGAERAGFDFSVTSDHYFPGWSPRATPPTPGASSAPPRRPRNASPDDIRDLPDDPLPPGGRRPEGRHAPTPVRGTVPPGPRLRGEPQRACGGRRLARRACPAGAAGRGRGDHPRALRGGERQLSRSPLRRGERQVVGSSRRAPADRSRGLRRPFVRTRRS